MSCALAWQERAYGQANGGASVRSVLDKIQELSSSTSALGSLDPLTLMLLAPFRRATPPSSHAQHYAPFSLPSLLSRLATYTLSTYSAKPRSVDALSAALHGWTNAGGRERLECAVCGASMRVEGWKGLKPEARDRLTAHFVRELNEAHRPSCPWRIRACDGECRTALGVWRPSHAYPHLVGHRSWSLSCPIKSRHNNNSSAGA